MRQLVFLTILIVLGTLLHALIPADASSRTPIPDPGTLASSIPLDCGGVTVELRYYDYAQPNPVKWKSIAVGLPRQRNFAQNTEDLDGSDLFYIDRNRDGWAEEVLSWDLAVERFEGDWCRVYEQIWKGGKA